MVGEGAEGEGAFVLDRGEGRELARGEAGVGLLAEPPSQAGGAQAQAGGDLEVVHER